MTGPPWCRNFVPVSKTDPPEDEMTTTTTRTLASGTMVEVDERGRMVGFVACGWQYLGYPTWTAPTAEEDPDGEWADAYAAICEDGPMVLECQARVRETHGGQGWACEHGHSHVGAEVRAAEGWDYAEEAEEARSLAKYGTEPRDLVTGAAFRF